jgi:hypothetical protein
VAVVVWVVFSAGDLDAIAAGFAAALGAMPLAAEPAAQAAGEVEAPDAAGFAAALGAMPLLVAAPKAKAAAVFAGALYQGNAHMAFIRRAGPHRDTSILDPNVSRASVGKVVVSTCVARRVAFAAMSAPTRRVTRRVGADISAKASLLATYVDTIIWPTVASEMFGPTWRCSDLGQPSGNARHCKLSRPRRRFARRRMQG